MHEQTCASIVQCKLSELTRFQSKLHCGWKTKLRHVTVGQNVLACILHAPMRVDKEDRGDLLRKQEVKASELTQN